MVIRGYPGQPNHFIGQPGGTTFVGKYSSVEILELNLSTVL